jgi:hypothetical protein
MRRARRFSAARSGGVSVAYYDNRGDAVAADR